MTPARGGALRAVDARSERDIRASAAGDERARNRAVEDGAPCRATSEGPHSPRRRAAALARAGGATGASPRRD